MTIKKRASRSGAETTSGSPLSVSDIEWSLKEGCIIQFLIIHQNRKVLEGMKANYEQGLLGYLEYHLAVVHLFESAINEAREHGSKFLSEQ